jgi:uncharacterized protein YbjT (DUF2867 family)
LEHIALEGRVKQVVVPGGTGYLGRPLIERLLQDGFRVAAVARPGSEAKLPSGCAAITGSALDCRTYRDRIPRGSTFVHLVGTPHPAPWKALEFRSVDLVSLEQSVAAAKHTAAGHFVFVSVAHPAPVMRAFIEVRIACERNIRESGLNATILRPWYILGPGHYWPYVLAPVYKVLETIPSTREGAVRLGLVRRSQMVNALMAAVASGATGTRIVETAAIRAC